MITEDIYVPARVLSIKGLSSSAKILCGVVVSHSVNNGFCTETDQELSRHVRVSARTVRKHLFELEKTGLLTIKTVSGERRLYPKEDMASLRQLIKERR